MRKGITITSAANFKTNISRYLKELDQEQVMFLTVNGEGNHVVLHVNQYEELCRYKERCLKGQSDNKWVDIIQSQRKPLETEQYDVLKATFKSIWGFYSDTELDEVEREIAADKEWLLHQSEVISAKERAFSELSDRVGWHDN